MDNIFCLTLEYQNQVCTSIFISDHHICKDSPLNSHGFQILLITNIRFYFRFIYIFRRKKLELINISFLSHESDKLARGLKDKV
ncbi:hypothetical protein BpHYR1_051368 [Brachionus plicatilis]|uniref:Uncharacterized protein n=1 Tax=Brachionus plicatilis TaxID=10195 RepID=A0A3M7RKH5_BRAPC|nr:hypothetical protein BpHYR1_051368 [Brachionus plicatilis]